MRPQQIKRDLPVLLIFSGSGLHLIALLLPVAKLQQGSQLMFGNQWRDPVSGLGDTAADEFVAAIRTGMLVVYQMAKDGLGTGINAHLSMKMQMRER